LPVTIPSRSPAARSAASISRTPSYIPSPSAPCSAA
jgi:hypothetical protein